MRERVNFEPNAPVMVTLEFDDGTPKTSEKYGREEFQYFLDGEQIMWVSPEVRELIRASGARAGDTIRIEKAKKGKAITWQVERVLPGYTATDEDIPSNIPHGEAHQESRGNAETAFGDGRAGTLGRYRREFATQQAQPAQNRPQAAPPAEAQPVDLKRPAAAAASEPAAEMTAALRGAVDAAIAAESYAASRGFALRLTAREVARIARDLAKGGKP